MFIRPSVGISILFTCKVVEYLINDAIIKKIMRKLTFPPFKPFFNQFRGIFLIQDCFSIVKTSFSGQALLQMYSSMFELLWYSSLPCFSLPNINTRNVLKECKFHGKRCRLL